MENWKLENSAQLRPSDSFAKQQKRTNCLEHCCKTGTRDLRLLQQNKFALGRLNFQHELILLRKVELLSSYYNSFCTTYNLICCKKVWFLWVVKRATSLFNSFYPQWPKPSCTSLLPVLPYLFLTRVSHLQLVVSISMFLWWSRL